VAVLAKFFQQLYVGSLFNSSPKKVNMIKGLKKLHSAEPACRKRSDNDHLKFVIHKKQDDHLKFDFIIELNGIKSWAVPDVPSMNPMDQRAAMEDAVEADRILNPDLSQEGLELLWDKGNYIPIDESGNVLSENQALDCLREGILRFFLQGKKLVGEFVLMKKATEHWLLIKRHDEFALYNSYSFETLVS
jgi:bifunctional non-homologous end joining protein LigD